MGFLLFKRLPSTGLGFVQGKRAVCTGGDVGELICKSAHALAGFGGVSIVEAVQEDIQSGFLVLGRGICGKAGAAAFDGNEAADVLVFCCDIEPQEQFIFGILGIIIAVIAFAKAYPCNTDRASFTDNLFIGMVHIHSPSVVDCDAQHTVADDALGLVTL